MDFKKDAQGNLINGKGDKLTDKDGSFLKVDDKGNLVNEKGNIVDEKGNIIQEEPEKLTLDGLSSHVKEFMPTNFNDLPREEQDKLVKVANKAKSADDKESFIQERNKTIGDLRKEIEGFKKEKGKKLTKSELEILKEGLKSRYDEESLKDMEAIASVMAKEESKPIKTMLKSILLDNLETAILSDPDIDAEIYAENSKEIEKEYNRFREPISPKEMRENLKEAALKVQKKAVDKLSEKEKETFEAKRKARLGAIPEIGEKGKSKDTRTDEEKTRDSILEAGKKPKAGIFG